MISNNYFFYFSAVGLAISLAALAIIFFLFVYKVLGGAKPGKDVLVFSDYLFFGRNTGSNLAALLLIFIYCFGLTLEFNRANDPIALLNNIPGVLAVILFILHGKFLSGLVYNSNGKILFIKEFFLRGGLSKCLLLLWLSRLLYVVWFILLMRNKLTY